MKKFFSATMLAICLLLTQTSNAQIYIFIDGVEGESQFRDFPNSTQIQSLSWGASNPTTISAATGGMSSGKLSFGDFTFMKSRGQASAGIQTALYTGRRIAKVEVRFYTAAQPTSYLTIILEDAMITSWQISGSGSERPTESISLLATRIKTEESVRNAAGVVKRVLTGWDIARNTTISW